MTIFFRTFRTLHDYKFSNNLRGVIQYKQILQELALIHQEKRISLFSHRPECIFLLNYIIVKLPEVI